MDAASRGSVDLGAGPVRPGAVFPDSKGIIAACSGAKLMDLAARYLWGQACHDLEYDVGHLRFSDPLQFGE